MTLNFDLSQFIKVEKRRVLSLPEIFGNVGGLYSFLATIALIFV